MKKRLKFKKFSFAHALCVSLCFHLAALFFAERYSVWFSTPTRKAVSGAGFEKKQKEEVLRNFFSSLEEKTHSNAPEATVEKQPVSQIGPLERITPSPFSPEIKKPAATSSSPLLRPQENIQRLQPPKTLRSIDQLKIPDLPSAPLKSLASYSPQALAVNVPSKNPPSPGIFVSLAPLSKTVSSLVYAPTAASLSIASSFTPSVRPFPTLSELNTVSYGDRFETELILLPKEEGEGYMFALTLIPRADLELPRIRQHFTFLIDRSNSMQNERLHAAKNAVRKAISELDRDDTFNIIAFDSKMEKFSPTSLSPTKETIEKAYAFLDAIQLGSLFSPADLYKPLLLTIPNQIGRPELYTAILLTDGENLAKRSAQKALLTQWTEYNQGKVSLFGLGIGGDVQLRTLEVAAAFNRGRVLHTNTVRGIKRKLLKLMKSIETPVAKNVSCKALTLTPSGEIELFSKLSQSPNLYLDQPYIILGTTPNLDDFVLFVQGQLKDRWLNIKKRISFSEAKEGDKSLRAEWALRKAYQIYEAHAYDRSTEYYKEINQLLEPYDLQIALK